MTNEMPKKGALFVPDMVTILGIALISIAMGAVGISWLRRALRDGCVANLSQLGRLDQIYRAEHGRSSADPDPIGKAYWLRLQYFKPELHREGNLFCCPFREEPKPGRCDYLGPAGEFSKLADGDYLACDEEGNHGTASQGMVLRKSGDVFELDGEDWIRLIKEKKCVP